MTTLFVFRKYTCTCRFHVFTDYVRDHINCLNAVCSLLINYNPLLESYVILNRGCPLIDWEDDPIL